MIFSTSAGRLVFDAYKDSQPLPEVVARDHGHNKTACYLEGVTKRYIICRFHCNEDCTLVALHASKQLLVLILLLDIKVRAG